MPLCLENNQKIGNLQDEMINMSKISHDTSTVRGVQTGYLVNAILIYEVLGNSDLFILLKYFFYE